MDEGTLNDLLECSVCLDRLDTSSKVLPCQHTFCRKCLKEIVHKHKELRCPECRILVIAKVEDLPPNVLLMRILEGMKNIPSRIQKTARFGNSQKAPETPPQAAPLALNTPERKLTGNKLNTPHTIAQKPYAKAMYDYEAKVQGDLSFKRGEIIYLKQRVDSNWYQGECGGKQGLFPLRYVQVMTPLPSHLPQCKALYDFQTDKHEEEGCLVFKEGDVINVIRRVDENWAEGKLDGRIGIFPLTFVELNNLARSLMKLSTNAQPGPSRVAPPTPTTEDSSPLIPTDHTTAPQSVKTSDLSSSSSSTTTPNVSSSNTSSNSSTAPSSPASPPPRNSRPLIQVGTPVKEKRHSFTGVSRSSHRHSLEIAPSECRSGDQGIEVKLPAPYVALYPYKPQKSDELELRKGGVYMVTERCQDGWFKGTSNRTQKCGVFPGNYVTYVSSKSGASTSGGATSSSSSNDPKSVSYSRSTKVACCPRQFNNNLPPPELPPRSVSPATTTASCPLGRTTSASVNSKSGAPAATPAVAATDKVRDRKDRGGGLMRRLASMKRSKSPPASFYSMDNPVFEDTSLAPGAHLTTNHAVHVRSGSCPSQLLQIQPSEHHRLFASSSSQRLKHKERPSALTHNLRVVDSAGSSDIDHRHHHHHRKSNSLDAGNRLKTGVQTVHELFKCEIPYPPNSDYELELQKDDIIYVHKKREDGWYKGTLQRTGKTGLFPASFAKAMQ